MNKRRELVSALGASALAAPLGLFAQQQGRVWRVGVLETTSTNSVFLQAFREGLHDLGYVEGKNLLIEYRSADGRLERLAELAMELVRAKVDVVVPRATNASLAAKNATAAIPIVAVEVGSPEESGLVKSLSHPGGNVTGLSSVSAELYEKRVELVLGDIAERSSKRSDTVCRFELRLAHSSQPLPTKCGGRSGRPLSALPPTASPSLRAPEATHG